ncbi:hypothetical protein HYR54_11315 [Candidatus Acetothermia bacterium]|nr:hypothetical protein [Candidatus Acetothermia bacterium]
MRKVIVFMLTTLDGFFAGPNGELDWHNVDEEFNEFAIDQLNSVDTLLFSDRDSPSSRFRRNQLAFST